MATSSFSHPQILLLCMIPLLITAAATLTCTQVYSDLHPCLSYVVISSSGGGNSSSSGGGGSSSSAVPTTCCIGLKVLNASATTTTHRQAVCLCIRSATSSISFTGSSLKLAAALPAKCGLRVSYQISPTTDCNKIQ